MQHEIIAKKLLYNNKHLDFLKFIQLFRGGVPLRHHDRLRRHPPSAAAQQPPRRQPGRGQRGFLLLLLRRRRRQARLRPLPRRRRGSGCILRGGLRQKVEEEERCESRYFI